MKRFLIVLLLVLPVSAADFLDTFEKMRQHVKMRLGISYTNMVVLPDTVLNEFIREAVVSRGQRILVDTIASTYSENDYLLDSLVERVIAVRWQYLDSVKTLTQLPESLWFEQTVKTLLGKQEYAAIPSFYDYYKDTAGLVHLLLHPTPVNRTADTFYVRSTAKIANIATLDSLVAINVELRTIILNQVLQSATAYLRIGTEQSMRIENFRGLNTAANDLQVKPNEARVAHEVDFGKNIGAISPRDGYDSVSVMVGMDSLVGIEAAYYSDGTQQLVVVADSTGLDYGSVYLGPKGSSDLSSATRIWQYFSVQNRPSFAMLDDNIYIVNGSHKGIVWDGNRARPYPLQAPGEPLIVPLTSSGPLDGEYRYVFRGRVYWGGSNWVTYSNGVISSPLRVKNGQVLITQFQFVPPDSDITAAVDSIQVKPYRSRGDMGTLDLADTAFWIGEYWILEGSVVGSLVFIDSVADVDLSSTDKYVFVEPGNWVGRDSSGAVDSRYGSPTFVSSDTTHPDGDTLLDIFEGWPTRQEDTLGVAYVSTLIDTATGIESDSGKALFVFCDAGGSSPSYRQLTVGLPRVPDTDTGIVINLYRACILQTGYDTTYWETSVWWDGRPTTIRQKWVDEFIPDTVILGNYHLIGQFVSTDTIFTDSIPYDSLQNTRVYKKGVAPPLMSRIFSYEGRLFGLQKSGLYFTAPVLADTLQAWGQMALTPINPDDGDMVTTAWPARGVIRVMKSYSSHNVYQDDALRWSKTEVSGYLGCVAGNSHIVGLGGHYYLSEQGVIRELEGLNLERTQTTELISPSLDNFDAYDIANLSEGQGFYFDRRYMLSLGDTTYVWDERSQTWATWGFSFADATLYSTEDQVRFLPGDTMYFIRPSDSILYRFATSTQDNGTDINFTWQSGALFVSPEYKRIRSAGVWVTSTDSSGSLSLDLYDESNSQALSVQHDSLQYAYTLKGFGENAVIYASLLLKPQGSTGLPTTVINAVDIEFSILGKPTIK